MKRQPLAQPPGHQRFLGIGHADARCLEDKTLKLGKLVVCDGNGLHADSLNIYMLFWPLALMVKGLVAIFLVFLSSRT